MINQSLRHFIRGWLPILAFAIQTNAASLKSETVLAWNDYLQFVNETLQARLGPGANFLWTLEDPKRADNVRAGEIVIAPALGHVPKKVPGGLIHHWVGAAFLANVKLDDVLVITRDYDHYKDFYRPSVIQSKLIARHGCDDASWMLFLNKSFFMRTALDVDYKITNARVDENRFYSISRTTRIQEIEGYGQPGEQRLPEGEGDGFAWKLYTLTRLEQRDGGVYLELEVIELSRGIPSVLRFVIEPIVRSVSRKLLLTSIRQTRDAVNDAKIGNVPRR